MNHPLGDTMEFNRPKLVELHRRYEQNEKRGRELAKLAKEDGKPEEIAAHEFQVAKAAGMKEAIEEIFFLHDGTFEVK